MLDFREVKILCKTYSRNNLKRRINSKTKGTGEE